MKDGAPPGSVTIMAGSGALPLLLADRLGAMGQPHRIMAFRGFADRKLRARADAVVGLLDLKAIIACLESWSTDRVTMAGGLRRPDPTALLDSFSLLRNRAEIADILARGDDNLLRAATALIEERGYPVVGIRDLAPELLAPSGVYGAIAPNAAAEAEIDLALSVLDGLSAYDIGQAAVVRGRRVLAIEGPEGTDRMIRRSRTLRGGLPLRRPPASGVLVKAAKHGQDLRVDLPAIGPRTVVNAARAGLAGIAVASGVTLVLDFRATVAVADRLGLFVTGVPARRMPGPLGEERGPAPP